MAVAVRVEDGQHQLVGDWAGIGPANEFLAHLRARAFSPATERAYAFDVANLARFLDEQGIALSAVEPMDVFGWVDWQVARTPATNQRVVRLAPPRTAAPATINRRVAAVRAFFEFLVMSGMQESNPVPAPRRGQGLRPTSRGVLGHLSPGRARGGGRLVREQRRLPESLDMADVQAFLSGLRTHRDRAMVLAMLLGGLRSAEVRGLLLSNVDQGRRRLRVIGKGGRERVVPVDGAFFAELGAYLRHERPPGLATPECFVVLRGPTTGAPVTEAGLRALFRRHREASGATRVRPHRLRAHLRHRACCRRDRPTRAARADGTRQPGNHQPVCASVGRASGGRVRRRPRHPGRPTMRSRW